MFVPKKIFGTNFWMWTDAGLRGNSYDRANGPIMNNIMSRNLSQLLSLKPPQKGIF